MVPDPFALIRVIRGRAGARHGTHLPPQPQLRHQRDKFHAAGRVVLIDPADPANQIVRTQQGALRRPLQHQAKASQRARSSLARWV